ncbi:hypothetical protein C9374_012547 [Naegleria lovaniensis]|uniref:AMP-dependent synthetase/ligase domain-containing protein n=1 Tax=Naegleria lovaniensis TaxID=51637 RepID=A0AA88GZX6_NAELO|nr:uncharacterized protein C9374_012547 [Naegleria lovaniensis]KAG2392295.1 hypothetical protein C9374_012547 [Naegleria lovaniensis]
MFQSVASWFRKSILLFILWQFQVPRDAFRFAWKRYGNAPALSSPTVSFSFEELKQRTLMIATILTKKGLKQGDKLFVCLPKGEEYLQGYLATMETGIILVSVPKTADSEYLKKMVGIVTPNVLLYDHEQCEHVATALKELVPQVESIRFDELENIFTQELKLSTTCLEFCTNTIEPTDLASIGFTSGTTGQPKALTATHGIFLTSLTLTVKNVELGPRLSQEVSLVGIPIQGAGSGMIMPTLLSGATLLIPKEFTADEFLRLIPLHQATRIFTTPSLLIDLLDHPKLKETDLTSLRNIIYGTELMPTPKLEEALKHFGPILQQGYGSAEVLPPVSMLSTKHHVLEDGITIAPRNVLSSVGRVVPQVQVRIASDENDEPLPQGSIGNILIQSPTQFKGYLNNPELSEKTLRGGWLHIGDVGYLDEEGLLHVLGRKPDMIQKSISNSDTKHIIYPRRVEEVLHDHPAVKETTYVQVSSDRAVMAVSLRNAFKHRLKEDSNELIQELKTFLSSKVSPEDMPDEFALMNELPRSVLAKVLRREVRQYFEQQQYQ